MHQTRPSVHPSHEFNPTLADVMGGKGLPPVYNIQTSGDITSTWKETRSRLYLSTNVKPRNLAIHGPRRLSRETPRTQRAGAAGARISVQSKAFTSKSPKRSPNPPVNSWNEIPDATTSNTVKGKRFPLSYILYQHVTRVTTRRSAQIEPLVYQSISTGACLRKYTAQAE